MKFQTLFFLLIIVIFRPVFGDCAKHLARGDSAYQIFDNKGALSHYQMARIQCPEEYQAAIKLVRAYLDYGEDLGHPEHSKKEYDKAIVLAESLYTNHPDNPEVTYYLAWSYGHRALYQSYKQQIQSVRKFEALLRKTITIDSTCAEAHLLLGIYNREVANIPWVVKTLARTLLGRIPDGRFDNALKHIECSIALQPLFVAAHFELAKTHDTMKNIEWAVQGYQRVLTMSLLDHSDWKKQQSARDRLKVLLPKLKKGEADTLHIAEPAVESVLDTD